MIVDWLVKAYRNYRFIVAALVVLAIAATPFLGAMVWSCVIWYWAGKAMFKVDDVHGREALKDYVAEMLIWLGIGLATGAVVIGFSCIIQSIYQIRDFVWFTILVASVGAVMGLIGWGVGVIRALQEIIELENQ